ncbi:GNAT family N-acetyltransferase [Ornithinimicrobium murale]|uniref:GNAT family N-acetyltransferase n=1 Tax=Ornithinimicrobium murale TaxID=1050153 RepID=UPI00192DDD18|nr:GNAT family N-acetyltransferase [Ornithinimicrobium murale]
MNLNIRDAVTQDLPTLATLLLPADGTEKDRGRLEGQLAMELRREVTRMVAEVDGVLVGVITVNKISGPPTRYLIHHRENPIGNFELGRLFVHPAYRRRGIGRALLGEVNYLGRILTALRPHETVAQFFLRSAGRVAHGRFNVPSGAVLVMAQRHTAWSKPLRTTEKIRAAAQ